MLEKRDRRQRHPDAQSRFEKWVLEQGGTDVLSKQLGIHRGSVVSWIARTKTPSLGNTIAIITMAKGALSIFDVYEGTTRC